MTSANLIVRGVLIVVATLGAALMTSNTAYADNHGGTWTKKSQKIAGAWKIVETAEGRFLELDDSFKTRRAPDLKLFLSPLEAGSVNAKNATSGSVLIAKLQKAKGAQRYEIPADIDLDAYQTLVLHCEKYTKLWGVSAR